MESSNSKRKRTAKTVTPLKRTTKPPREVPDLEPDLESEVEDTDAEEDDESRYATEADLTAAESVKSSASELDEDEDEDEEDTYGGKGGSKKQTRKLQTPIAKRKNGEDEQDSDTSLAGHARSGATVRGPGGKTILYLPTPRKAGDTPYEDHTIHPNTLLFLQDLKENNRREWLKMNNTDFRTSEKDFESFAEALTEKIIEVDDTIPELPFKDIRFWIYRDIRFSKDLTPYKPLSLVRRHIDRKPHKIKNVLMQDGLRKEFLGNIPKDSKKAVQAFIKHNEEMMLKIKPNVTYLNSVVMPDEPSSGEEE
ncbi:MAG: hypothetical protein M1826_003189 [Phylliscum demangeonii]|nr:MAG: hypothetical protein M1826_003189 [Phylliscum demangeonii]